METNERAWHYSIPIPPAPLSTITATQLSEITFGQALDAYLSAGGESRYATEGLRRLCGPTPLGIIDQIWVDTVASRLKPFASPSTRQRHVYVLISAVLKHAAAHGWCSSFRITRPKAVKRIFTPPPKEALDAFMRSAGPSLKRIARFKLETGATEHEILSLDWDGVALLKRQVRLQRADGKVRIVSISPAIAEMLARLSHNRVGRVFRADNGRPYKTQGQYGGRLKTAFAGASKRSGANVTFETLHRVWRTRRMDVDRHFGSNSDG